MRISKTVKYRLYGEFTYVRNIAARRDYLFNSIVFDLFQIVSSTLECTERILLEKLKKQYQVEDQETFHRDIKDFVHKLMEEEILYEESEGRHQDDVFQMVQEQCLQGHYLYGACLELTYRCNERCIHCYADDQKYGEEMGFAQYRALLDELAELGCISLLLTGGEVSLHPEFLDIAEYASRKGFLVDIYTNGYHIDEEMFQRMTALAPNSISFSLYGGDAKSHDAVTQVPGSFEKSLRCLMACKCAGIDTYIKTAALQQNIEELEKLYKLGSLLDISVEASRIILPSHEGSKRVSDLRLNRTEQYICLLEWEEHYLKRIPQKRGWEPGIPFCGAGRSTLSIDPYGNVFPCNALRINLGNISECTLHEIWDNMETVLDSWLPAGYLKQECSFCQHGEFCNVCPGRAFSENNRFETAQEICLSARAAYQYIKKKGESKQ